MSPKSHVILAGNIGAGKQLLADALSEELGLMVFKEDSADNPYLQRFYMDRPRWALASQLWFLGDGLRRQRDIARGGGGTVQERSHYEHFFVFAHQLRDDGDLSEHDFATLSGLYYAVEDLVPPPDLLVVLKSDPEELMDRNTGIAGLTISYLHGLENRYQNMIDSWVASPLIVIDTRAASPYQEDGLNAAVASVAGHMLSAR